MQQQMNLSQIFYSKCFFIINYFIKLIMKIYVTSKNFRLFKTIDKNNFIVINY